MRTKNTFRLIILLLFFLALKSCKPATSQTDKIFIKQYLERLENSKTYLITVANLLPETLYGFKPMAQSMSFEEHLMHIGWAMDWHSQTLISGRKARDWDTDTELKVDNKTKEDIIKTIQNTFDTTIAFIKNFEHNRLDDQLEYFGTTRTKRQILLLLTDHITHHRGQMLVYLRLNNIKPPRYVLYQ